MARGLSNLDQVCWSVISMSTPSLSLPPFPAYVQVWGGLLRHVHEEELRLIPRTTEIPPARHLFVLQKPGESRSKIVTRKRCNNCKNTRKKDCSRDEPCNYCRNGRHRCTYPSGPYPLATIEDTRQHQADSSSKEDPPLSDKMPVDEHDSASTSNESRSFLQIDKFKCVTEKNYRAI